MKPMTSRLLICVIVGMLAFGLVACDQSTAAPANTPEPPPPTSTPTLTPTPESSPTPQPSPTPEGVLPPDPQEFTIQTADGREIPARYYPSAQPYAPVVVLFHWAPGDINDWNEVAVWLQNRGVQNPFPNPSVESWWDPSWFPEIPEGTSYAVLTVSLESCLPFPAGCQDFVPEQWLLDVQAAMLAATELEGVDPTRIAAIGSSIGADGAPDGCAWLNQQRPGSCRGALSLSPGDYLNIPYADVVKELSESDPPVPVWCLADEAEIGFCQIAGYPAYQAYLIPNGAHGTMMLRPDLDPLPMQLILDFLAQTIGQ